MRILFALGFLVGCATTQKQAELTSQGVHNQNPPHVDALVNAQKSCNQRPDLCRGLQPTQAPVQSSGPFLPQPE